MSSLDNRGYGKPQPGSLEDDEATKKRLKLQQEEEAAGKFISAIPENRKEDSDAGSYGESPLYFRLLFSLPIMGLFMQWLVPLYGISTEENTLQLLGVLAVAAALLLLCGVFRHPGWLIPLLQTVVILFSWIYMCGESGETNWLGAYIKGMPGDVILLISGKLSELSTESRLLFLLSGWGLLVASVQHLALFKRSISLFSAVSLLYLLLLDRLLALHTMKQLVLSAGLILWLQGMCGLLALKERNKGGRKIPYTRWWSIAFIGAASVAVLSWAGGERFGPQPDRPVSLQPAISRLQSRAAGEKPRETGWADSAMTGYSSGEAELGAPLSRSTDPVFTVESRRPVYSRGESFALYDGRRWSMGQSAYSPLNLAALPEEGISATARNRVLHQVIRLAVPSSGGLPLFSAGQVLDVPEVKLADGSRLGFVFANQARDSFRLPEIADSAAIMEYTLDSLLPETDPAVLRRVTGPDPAEVRNIYLELPVSLPRRVHELAAELTASASSRYDAAAAVQDYLQRRYPYTLDTRVPPSGTDFVDDFLFEAQQGYCVHFATAMATLLRSAGIPARYVQGYGPGTAEAGSVPQRYAVTQGDAHAWVEVYFPGAGWVPFDPTPGAGLAAGSALPPAPAAAAAPPVTPAPAAPGAGVPPARLRQGGQAPAPLPAAALLLPAAAWRWRRSLRLLRFASRRRRAGPELLLKSAALAWRGLAARYGAPPPGVTGREYAASLPIEDARLRAAVWRFVRQWEALAYSPPGPAARRCRAASVPASTAAAPAGSEAAAEFIRVCLDITLRLT